jgi:hypothetical protein
VTKPFLVLLLLATSACNDARQEPTGRAGSLDGRDGGSDVEADDAPNGEDDDDDDDRSEPATGVGSRVAGALSSDEFQQAACQLAGTVAHAEDPSVSCDAVVESCLNAVGGLDASAFAGAVALPDETLELEDCNVTAKQADACLADIVEVLVDLSQDLSCDVDAGALQSDLGPELLLGAPTCLQVAIACPQLLELIATAVPM